MLPYDACDSEESRLHAVSKLTGHYSSPGSHSPARLTCLSQGSCSDDRKVEYKQQAKLRFMMVYIIDLGTL